MSDRIHDHTGKLDPELRAATERALTPDQRPAACLETDCAEPVHGFSITWLGNLRISVGACIGHNDDLVRRMRRVQAAMDADPTAGQERLHGLLISELGLNLPPLHELRLRAGYGSDRTVS